ncbi:hypothetical protein HG537_0A02130 [Torulaspora globosa]|uniref:Transcriptional regulatory protein SDS3 n=1 Tax=Torulaspora globosa TaxID=48254 RepID=A0A7H9HKS8_9SACH|nr:hypothetical protein HG537_0A02130 [Torulaspora sp. CBS 2947]
MSQKQVNQDVPRKDKRRHNIESKVAKIRQKFAADRDVHYKDRLTALQADLTTLHQGNNRTYLRKLRDLEEARDLELVRLRLFEEYRVSRSRIEFQEDIESAREEHERLVKLCKERLYESIEQKIKQLQEDRLLMDVANAHSYAMDYNRTKYQKYTRSHTAGGWESSSNELGRDSPSESATDTATDRRSLRKRAATKTANAVAESDFQTNSSAIALTNGNGNGNGYTRQSTHDSKAEGNSDADLLQSISDYGDLQALLFGEKDPDAKSNDKKKHRTSQRYTAKAAPPLQSLKPEEVTDDIAYIRQLTGQPPAPFKSRILD